MVTLFQRLCDGCLYIHMCCRRWWSVGWLVGFLNIEVRNSSQYLQKKSSLVESNLSLRGAVEDTKHLCHFIECMEGGRCDEVRVVSS